MFRPALHSVLRSPVARGSISTPGRSLLLTRLLSQETRATIQSALSASPVVLFMKGTPQHPECGFSRAVVQVLDLHGVPSEKIQAYNVLVDAELRTGIKEFSEWPTIPQIYVNGEFVGGCDILLGMHQSGELEELLVKKNIISPEEQPEPSQSQASST